MKKESVVLFEVNNGVGWIKLNRPKVINSLNLQMVKLIYDKLKIWKKSDDVAMVCIVGAGEKGLCAGGDMRRFYDIKGTDSENEACQFFTIEYKMDLLIHYFTKPILIYMDGVVMGGGVGMSNGASHRVVNTKSKWAMPEMNIGFFPDVGSSYFLNKMPGFIGRYLALTAKVLPTEDIIYLGAADYSVDKNQWRLMIQEISERVWYVSTAEKKLDELVSRFQSSQLPQSQLALLENEINDHFKYDSVEKIILSLQEAANKGNQWAHETANILLSYSPVSLKVTFEQLQRAKQYNLLDCFKMELNISVNFMDNNNFYEGVRAVLVDKDKKPKWEPPLLNEVSEKYIYSFFCHDWQRNNHPLDNLEKIIN